MDTIELGLRLIGAFYVFAGAVATRAALASHVIDRALAAISGQRPPRRETLLTAWHVGAATLVLAGGVALVLLLDASPWIFLASALGQAAYLVILAPYYFDVADPPDPKGRRQTTNAFLVYAVATGLVSWAALAGRLQPTAGVAPWALAAGLAALIMQAGRVARGLWPLRASGTVSDADAEPEETVYGEDGDRRTITVMADYDCHALWGFDGDAHGNMAPERLGLSPELVHDLEAWADDYTASLDRDDPATSRWTDDERRAHAARAEELALRLARERPDLRVQVRDGETGALRHVAGDGDAA